MIFSYQVLVKKAKHNKTFLNGTLFSFFSLFSKGCAFLLLIILAKFILPSDYGRLSMFNTIVTLLGFFIGLSTYGYVSVSYFRNSLLEFKKDFTTIFIIHSVSFIILTIIVSLFGSFFVSSLELTLPLMYAAILISYLQLLFDLHQNFLRIQERVVEFGIWNSIFAIANLFLAILLVVVFKQGWVGKINAQLVCAFFVGVLAIIYFIKKKYLVWNLEWGRFKSVFYFGLPLIPHSAAGWIRQGCDTYIINYHYSTYEVGVFSFALNLVSVIIMIGTAFNATNQVTLYSILSQKDLNSSSKSQQLRKQTRMIGFMFIIFGIVYICSIIPFVEFLMPKYKESLPYFLILSVYGLLQCFYFLFCNYFFYFKDTKRLMYITFISSTLHLVLSLFLTKYSLFLTAVLYVFIQMLIVSSVYKTSRKILAMHL